jgi:hypothetical protein
MSRVALLLAVPIMLACTKKDEPAPDTTAVAAPAPAAAAPAATAPVNYAGTWKFTVMPADKDTVILSYSLVATADKTGWKLMLPGRPAMTPTVTSMDNDSVVLDNGPYSSVLRKKVSVTTHSSMHMDGDKLVGTTIAHYSSKGPDSVANLRITGTRQ